MENQKDDKKIFWLVLPFFSIDRKDNKSVIQKVADCDSPINEHMPKWTNNWQHLIFPQIKL